MNTRIEKLHLWGKYVLLAAFVLLLSFPWLQAKADEKMTDYTTLHPIFGKRVTVLHCLIMLKTDSLSISICCLTNSRLQNSLMC